MLMLTLNGRRVSRRHEKGRIIAPTSKFIFMKKFFLSICAVAMAATGMAQDASQPQGSWYLGSGDATELLQIFSDDGVGLNATVGYAVAVVPSTPWTCPLEVNTSWAITTWGSI